MCITTVAISSSSESMRLASAEGGTVASVGVAGGAAESAWAWRGKARPVRQSQASPAFRAGGNVWFGMDAHCRVDAAACVGRSRKAWEVAPARTARRALSSPR